MSVFTEIVKEIPLSAVLKERLTLAEVEMSGLKQANARLTTENQILRSDLSKAREEIQRHNQILQGEFVEYRGALFKRKPGGGYVDDAFCRQCHNPMVSIHRTPFQCVRCNVMVNFGSWDLPKIVTELPPTK